MWNKLTEEERYDKNNVWNNIQNLKHKTRNVTWIKFYKTMSMLILLYEVKSEKRKEKGKQNSRICNDISEKKKTKESRKLDHTNE